MTELTAAAGLVRKFLSFARSAGADEQELIRRAGIVGEELASQNRRLAVTQFRAAVRAGIDLTGASALALRYGHAVDLASFSVVGLLVDACSTLAEAVAQLDRYHPLVIEVDFASRRRFELQRAEEGLWLVDLRFGADEWPELTEITFGWLAAMARKRDSAMGFTEAQFTHPAPAHADEYLKSFGARVRFSSPRNALLLEPDRRNAVAARPSHAHDIFRDHAEDLLGELHKGRLTRGSVERLVAANLSAGAANVNAIAAELGVSRQTLFRRLRAEGVSFEQVLDEMRMRLAKQYLSKDRMSVGDAAYALGFSDRSAFSRAYKRWTGSSPSRFRG